jgi:hypothetical protein
VQANEAFAKSVKGTVIAAGASRVSLPECVSRLHSYDEAVDVAGGTATSLYANVTEVAISHLRSEFDKLDDMRAKQAYVTPTAVIPPFLSK